MNEVVERAAKAAYESWRKSIREEKLFYCSWDDLYPDTKKVQIEAQRAAIEALREPPESVISALQQWGVCAGDIDKGWNAAIDELLRD